MAPRTSTSSVFSSSSAKSKGKLSAPSSKGKEKATATNLPGKESPPEKEKDKVPRKRRSQNARTVSKAATKNWKILSIESRQAVLETVSSTIPMVLNPIKSQNRKVFVQHHIHQVMKSIEKRLGKCKVPGVSKGKLQDVSRLKLNNAKLEDMLVKDMPLMETLETKIDEETGMCEKEEQKLFDLRETVRELNANFRQLRDERLHPLLQSTEPPPEEDISFAVFSMMEPSRKVDTEFAIEEDSKFTDVMTPIMKKLQEIQGNSQWVSDSLKEVEKLEASVLKVARRNGLSKATELI